MAAVTVAAQKPEQVFNPAFGTKSVRANGLMHRRLGMFTVGTTADTYDTGIPGIVAVAWEAEANGDRIAVTSSGTTVTFSFAAGTNPTGWLHVWSAN